MHLLRPVLTSRSFRQNSRTSASPAPTGRDAQPSLIGRQGLTTIPQCTSTGHVHIVLYQHTTHIQLCSVEQSERVVEPYRSPADAGSAARRREVQAPRLKPALETGGGLNGAVSSVEFRNLGAFNHPTACTALPRQTRLRRPLKRGTPTHAAAPCSVRAPAHCAFSSSTPLKSTILYCGLY